VEASFQRGPLADETILDHLDEHAVEATDHREVIEPAITFELEHPDEPASLGGHGAHSRSSAAMPSALGPV
jgi:hypothetical protein